MKTRANVGALIKSRREELGMSQEELAILVGYKSRSSIQKIEKEVQLPISKIYEIAVALHVPPGYLMGWIDDEHIKSVNAIRIPVLGRVAAGIPISAVENIIDYEEISEDMALTGEFFALKIKGDSMEPRIEDGSIVIARQQEDADNGNIVIALVNGDDAVCKKLVKSQSGISLVSLNPKYDPMLFTNEDIESLPVKIIGRVVEVRTTL